MCSWVFRKEHLALQVVVGILRRLAEEKREWDREPHDMFIPNGSKIHTGWQLLPPEERGVGGLHLGLQLHGEGYLVANYGHWD